MGVDKEATVCVVSAAIGCLCAELLRQKEDHPECTALVLWHLWGILVTVRKPYAYPEAALQKHGTKGFILLATFELFVCAELKGILFVKEICWF